MQVHEVETTAFTTITTSNGQFVSATPISTSSATESNVAWTLTSPSGVNVSALERKL